MKAHLELAGSGAAGTDAMKPPRSWGRARGSSGLAAPPSREPARIGVIRNPHARRNRSAAARETLPGVRVEEPRTLEALAAALADFASRGLDLLVVDGGDGAVREVLSRAPELFGGALPPMAVLPSGTTNVLAGDLGARADWSLAAAAASPRSVVRHPIEIRRTDAPEPLRRGFVFGAGVYVEAIRLAERARRVRAVGGVALVGAALAEVAARTALGGRGGARRAGVPMRLQHGMEEARFLVLASTLERLPLGVRPFGRSRGGLKVLDVAGTPRRLRSALPLLLSGGDRPWLAAAGYRRATPERLHLTLQTPYVLDGEEFEGGELVLALGAPIRFVVP